MSIENLAKILKQTPAELIRQADVHTCAVQAWLSSRAPNATQMDGVGVKITSTGLPIPLLNLVLSQGYPLDTPEKVISDDIELAKSFFAKRNVPWYWWLGPNPQPPDMSQRLENHGLVCQSPPLPTMIAPLPARSVTYNPLIRVWLATTPADLAAASSIRRVAFRFPEGAALDYFEAMSDDWLNGDPARLYLAGLGDGPPAAIGAWIMGAELPGVYVMATLPDWRRQGLGKAILARLVADAAIDRHPFMVLTASRFGYPLYQQFGFEQIFDYGIYRPTI